MGSNQAATQMQLSFFRGDLKTKNVPNCGKSRCCEKPDQISITRPTESTEHILTQCPAYSEVRKRILPEYSSLCGRSGVDFSQFLDNGKLLCQFILDPTSLNLPAIISSSDPNLGSYFRKSRDLCFSIHNTRLKILREKKECGYTNTK